MNKKIIIAILIVILIAVVGIFAFSQIQKTDTQLNFITGNSLKNGDAVQFVLRDANGNVLENQNVTISFETNGQTQNYTVITNSEGQGSLILNDEELGEHNITVTYNGDGKYNGCSASQIITIEEGEEGEDSDYTDDSSQATSNDNSTSSSSSDSSSNLNYDSELNVHYDDNGKVVGGQNDGANYDDLKNNPPQVDAEGNLV